MKTLKEITNKATAFFTAAALVYTLALAAANPKITEQGRIYSLIFQNYMLILAYASVFGASFLIFKRDKILPAAKRIIHILILYTAMIGILFLMANVTDDLRDKILFILFATLLFALVYCAGMFISSVFKKKDVGRYR